MAQASRQAGKREKKDVVNIDCIMVHSENGTKY